MTDVHRPVKHRIDHFNSHARVGRDQPDQQPQQASSDFNSHARVGRDRSHAFDAVIVYISTHTPAWGVTVTDLSTV